MRTLQKSTRFAVKNLSNNNRKSLLLVVGFWGAPHKHTHTHPSIETMGAIKFIQVNPNSSSLVQNNNDGKPNPLQGEKTPNTVSSAEATPPELSS